VLATAQTGTGKTLGFLIPIVEMLQKSEVKGAQALILLPDARIGDAGGKSISHDSHQFIADCGFGRWADWPKGFAA